MTRAVTTTLALLLGLSAALAAQDMPDPSLIHGKAIPAAELGDGTVTVRVVREAIGNNVGGQAVTVRGGGVTRTATTDELGRAEFRALPAGAELRAEATVDGEPLVSEPFQAPGAGGLRVILVAGIARAAERKEEEAARARSAPPVRGVVTFGGNTRIIGEFQNDSLFMFYQLDIVNNARAPVDLGGPLEIELPVRAAGATLLEGAPATASINGRHVIIQSPFAPGTTTVNVQFQLPYSSSRTSVVQHFPAAVPELSVFIERLGAVTMSSPQLQPAGERAAPDGTTFFAATGSGIAAGTDVVLQLDNLPAQGRTAAYIALALALGLLGFGVWMSMTAHRATGIEGLKARREGLLARLEDLERKRQQARVSDDKYLSRRQRLMTELEEVYHEIDGVGGRPRGGDEGVAA